MNQEWKDETLSLIQKPKSKVDPLSIKLDPEAAQPYSVLYVFKLAPASIF